MAEGLPPTNGSAPISAYDIQAPNFAEQGKAQAAGAMAEGWWDDLIRKYVLAHGSGGSVILSALGSFFDTIMAVFVEFVGKAQAGGTPGFFTLLSTLLGDLMGVDISQDHVAAAWRKGGSMAAFKAVGAAYWKAILAQLGSPATLTPEGGLAAAEGFLGYLFGFSIREGNIAMLASVIPEEWRFMDGIDEYAEALRSSLGLGRLTRQALHPLIQTLITDPLTWYVNKTYHPKRLGESTAIKAWAMGVLKDSDLETEMEYAGYNPSLSDILKNEYLGKLSVSDVERLTAAKKMNEDSAIYAIRQSGVQEGTAALMLDAARRRAAQGVVDQLVMVIRNNFLDGYIGPETRDALWSDLPLPEIQLSYLKLEADTMKGQPRKRLSLAEVQSAFVEGLIDSDAVATFLKAEGYADDDQVTLWYQTLLKLGTQEAKKAVAQYAYDKAKAKAEAKGEAPPPPPPILAETPGIPGL